MINLNLLRTATLFPHALVRPILLLTAVILVVVLGFLQFKGYPESASQSVRSIEIVPSPTPNLIPSSSPSPTTGVTLKEVFDYQLKDYKSELDGFDANVKLQALFIVFTLLLILRRSDSLNIFGNQLPLQWLHLFAPIVLLYLWLNFGFLLHGLIQSRLLGVDILNRLSPSTAYLGKSLFRDSGFIDGWFLSFVDSKASGIGDFSGIDRNSGPSTAGFLLLVLGTLVSATHACLIAITFIGCRRYLRQPSSRFLLVYYLLPLVPLALLVASHIQFAYGGSNRNYIQLYIAFMTIPLVAVLLWISIIVDREVDPASVQCLRRPLRMIRPNDTSATKPRRRLAYPGSLGLTTQHADPVESFRTVSLIGDSLSTGFYVGSYRGMLLRMWRAWRGTWFIGVPGDGSKGEGILERLSDDAPIAAVLHATPRAQVDAGGSRGLIDLITNTWHLSHQVDEVLIGEFPDLLLFWIGHNNIDWRSRYKSLTAEACEALSAEFAECYERQLRRLLKGAVISKKPIVIIVFGLINFESFFQARSEAERRRKGDSTQYPYLEKDYKFFDSMRLEHRSGMVRLAEFYNQRIEAMCRDLGEEIRESDVRLVYSDAMSKAEITGADMLNESDAWHPSPAGHRMLAQSAYDAIKKQLEYLGWESEGGAATVNDGEACLPL
jgi:lysophospholipase L1-like esterase